MDADHTMKARVRLTAKQLTLAPVSLLDALDQAHRTFLATNGGVGAIAQTYVFDCDWYLIEVDGPGTAVRPIVTALLDIAHAVTA